MVTDAAASTFPIFVRQPGGRLTRDQAEFARGFRGDLPAHRITDAMQRAAGVQNR